MADSADAFWVFGYGSLMWDPGFPHLARARARIFGHRRALCLLSVRNRGTSERPGLVLALDRGGSCDGIAFAVAPSDEAEVRAYLWRREMGTDAYRPLTVTAHLADGRRVPALTFAARTDHPQYYHPASSEEAGRLVAQGRGSMGTALDYLRNVVRHLDDIGIGDGPLHQVLAAAERCESAVATGCG